MMVGGMLIAFREHLAGGIISATSSSFCLLASLEDFLSPSSSQSSPSVYLGNSCLFHSLSPPCYELARFALLVGLDLISFINYAKRGASSNFFGNTDCPHRVLWSFFCWFKWISNNASSSMSIATLFAAHKDAHFGKNASLLASHNG